MKKIQVVEQFRQGKTGDLDKCEDQIFISESFISVIDGATARNAKTWDGKAPGKIAADLIAEALTEVAADASMEKTFSIINQKIYSWYQEKGIAEEVKKNSSVRTSASLIIYSAHFNQVWMLGDCQALIDGNQHLTNEKRIDMISAEHRAIVLETEIRDGKTIEELLKNDPGRKAIIPFIEKQAKLQNTDGPYSYVVMDGFFEDYSRIKVVELDDDIKEIVLTSDGYSDIKDTLKKTESKLAEILENDPLCFRVIKTTKGKVDGNVSFDDRAYLRASIS